MHRYEITAVINDLPTNEEVVKPVEVKPEERPKREFLPFKRMTINGIPFTKSEPYYFGDENSLADVHFWRLENAELGVAAYIGFPHFRVFEKVSEIYDDHGVLLYYGTKEGRVYLMEVSVERDEMWDMGPVFNRWGKLPRPYHLCQERVNNILTGRAK